MQHFLIRHAHAVDLTPDQARPLSAKGRNQAARLARFLGGNEQFAPAEIWHSPLVRARETAELLVSGWQRAAPPLRERHGLTPEDDPREIARALAESGRCVAVVGHEPHLGALTSLLVTGDSGWPVVVMRKGAVVALEGAGARWQIGWQVVPEILG